LLQTLNCCPRIGAEHAEQLGHVCTVPQQLFGLTSLIAFQYPEMEYHDLGGEYYFRLDPQRPWRHLVKRLESLGYKVTVTQRTAA
jgi:hypothetical protein